MGRSRPARERLACLRPRLPVTAAGARSTCASSQPGHRAASRSADTARRIFGGPPGGRPARWQRRVPTGARRPGRSGRPAGRCSPLVVVPAEHLGQRPGCLGQRRVEHARRGVADDVTQTRGLVLYRKMPAIGPSAAAANAALTCSAVTSRPSTTARSVSDPSSTGTRSATPSSFPATAGWPARWPGPRRSWSARC